MLDVSDEIGAVSEGAEETCLTVSTLTKKRLLTRYYTNVKVIPVFLRRKLSSFLDHTMPPIVSAVLVIFARCHVVQAVNLTVMLDRWI